MIWVKFTISAAVIIMAGIQLTKYADTLSERLNVGKVWIGVVLLGLVTSLPEAISCLEAVISLNAADLAVGNLAGSNNFNLMLFVVLDVIYRKGAVTNKFKFDRSHKLTALFAVVLSLIVALEIFLASKNMSMSVGRISVGSFLIFAVYFAGMRKLAGHGMTESAAAGNKDVSAGPSLNKIYTNLLISTILVIMSGIWLANICDTIAMTTGLGRTFVGSVLLALVTSLPEMVVTISALKMGQLDLAVGNIFGSNMTNTFIVFICGIFHKNVPILNAVDFVHVFTVLMSIVLTVVVVIGIRHKGKKEYFGFGWDTLLMTFLFIMGTGLLYKFR